jgi:hypothetical protein
MFLCLLGACASGFDVSVWKLNLWMLKTNGPIQGVVAESLKNEDLEFSVSFFHCTVECKRPVLYYVLSFYWNIGIYVWVIILQNYVSLYHS